MFKFKPEGISLNGMQRVYFTCHPEDHARYFERISGDILKVQRCAVFYNLDEGEYEDAETDLAQMNLFVIPVTTRLLTKPCRTVKFDIPFALEHHIPILPLMMESGLDELYERVFGDLHYLDPNASDDTARSFEEKFKNYITSVLIGDELAEKIRRAFDAYIFLSYRKKDRRYANELMRLIHKNEFCRDIAIWYDEFLTPGEGFNEAIAAALEKSELFALVVTPSLLELNDLGLPNYVMKEEYPAARRSGKKVLPAEMEETDGKALSGKFDGIGSTVKKEDEAALSAALHDALGEIAIAENDDDPEHNFFIGLAYLGGIDVEIDHERAKRLIEGAAEAGLIEAAEKLVSMYENDEGVQRDYYAAIEWRKKLVELLEKRSDEDGSLKNRIELLIALEGLGDAYLAVGRLDEAKQAYQRQYDLSERFDSEMPGQFTRTLSVSLSRLGDISKAEGDLNEARRLYSRSLEIRERIAEETGTIQAWRDLSVSLNKLGDISSAEGDLDEARRFYSRSLEILGRIAEETGTVEARRDLSVSLNRLGDISSAEGDLTEARRLYSRSLEIDERIAEEADTIEARRDLSISLNKLGDISSAEGDPAEARRLYSRSLEIRERIAEETGTVEARRDLSISLDNLGVISRAEGDLAEARRLFSRSLEIRGRIAEETGTIEARRDLSVSLNNLGDISSAEGDPAEARRLFYRALEIDERIAEETGTLQARRDLSVSLSRLGNISRAEGDLDGARRLFSRSLEIRERITEETDTIEARRDLSVSLNKLGDISRAEGDLPRARRLYSRSLEIRGRIAEETDTVEARRDLSINLERLGDISKAEGDLDEARRFYSRSLEIRERIAEETGTLQARRDLSVSLNNLGDISRAEGDPAEARRLYSRSLEIRERIAEETGTVEALDDLAVSYVKVATLREPYDRALLEKARDIYRALAQNCPGVERFAKFLGIIERTLNSL